MKWITIKGYHKKMNTLSDLVKRDPHLWLEVKDFLDITVDDLMNDGIPDKGSYIEKWVDPRYIIHCIWDTKKLVNWLNMNNKEFIKRIETMPVELYGYKTIMKNTVYYAIDGNHRIAAALKKGLRVKAKIFAIYPLPKALSVRLTTYGELIKIYRDREEQVLWISNIKKNKILSLIIITNVRGLKFETTYSIISRFNIISNK